VKSQALRKTSSSFLKKRSKKLLSLERHAAPRHTPKSQKFFGFFSKEHPCLPSSEAATLTTPPP
jgi:hypothetical protein